jgi:hypothetical protein
MDYAKRLVLETEGERGAAERGWLGEEAYEAEIERQKREYEEYLRAQGDE